MTASEHNSIAIEQLAPSRLILTHSDSLFDRAENSNAYVQAVWCTAGALDKRQGNAQ